MALANETINKQRHTYFSYIWRGVAIAAIGGYCGFMVLRNGLGTAVQTGGGANVLVRKLMKWLSQFGINAEQFVTYCLAGLFGVLVIIGIFNLVRGISRMSAKSTGFGKSVSAQMKTGESFDDVINSINEDMSLEPYVFGTVSIGRKWIADAEVMRLSEIRGAFWFDNGMEDNVLCCVDEMQNVWAASFRYSTERDNAAEHLTKSLPNLVCGDKDDYIAYLSSDSLNEDIENEAQDAGKPAPVLALSGDTTFSFIDVDGIPTSNFTSETVCKSLQALNDSQSIALKVLTPRTSIVSEIHFTCQSGKTKIDILYLQKKEEYHTINVVERNEAILILKNILSQKCMPNFSVAQK